MADMKDVVVDVSINSAIEEDPNDVWDLVLVFPLKEDAKPPPTCAERLFGASEEEKVDDRHNMDYFVDTLMGLNRKGEEDPSRRIFHTERCFLSGEGVKPEAADAMQKSASGKQRRASSVARGKKQQVLDQRKKILQDEYQTIFQTVDPVGTKFWSEKMVEVIVRRLQLACGLETYMFYSADSDEIIVKVRADMVDLMIEADRTDYIMQVENQPFHKHQEVSEKAFALRWEEQSADLAKRMNYDHIVSYAEATEKAKEMIQEICDPDEMTEPQMDPNLFGTQTQPSLHPKILDYVKSIGHRGDEVEGTLSEKLQRWTTGWSDQSYVSPYAEYRIEPKFQPLFRKYKVSEMGDQYTLFRQVDRIRLVSSIIGRNLNLDRMVARKIIKFSVWLHDPFTYRDLRKNWALKFLPVNITRGQPIDLIRDYYGEKTALYFAWLQYYTRFLIPVSIIGWGIFLLAILGSEFARGIGLVLFGGVVTIWATMFLEVWKRKNSELNLLWGTHDAKATERERPEFIGVTRRNPVTDEPEVFHRRLWWYHRRVGGSAIVLGIFIMVVIAAAVSLFMFKYATRKDPNSVIYVGVVNAVQIGLFNSIYRKVAQILNDWENHRTPTEYENNLTVKVFSFQFVNSFITFFYISFVKTHWEGCVDRPNCEVCERDSNGLSLNTPANCEQDLNGCESCLYELQTQLLSIFLTRLIVSNAMEIGIPFLKYKLALYMELRSSSKSEQNQSNALAEGLGDGVAAVENLAMVFKYEQAEKETKFNKYEELEAFDDYNEIVLQFGFVSLFVVGFPLTPFLALVNNIAEMHIDGYKLTSNTRRPYPVRTANIGSWYFFLDLMSTISVMTNIGIIIFTSPLFDNLNITYRFLMFLAAEHSLLLLKFLISEVVPDEHGTISIIRARHETIVQRVFLGIEEDDNSKFEEAAENLDLSIHPPTAKKVNKITQALEDIQGATGIGRPISKSQEVASGV